MHVIGCIVIDKVLYPERIVPRGKVFKLYNAFAVYFRQHVGIGYVVAVLVEILGFKFRSVEFILVSVRSCIAYFRRGVLYPSDDVTFLVNGAAHRFEFAPA